LNAETAAQGSWVDGWYVVPYHVMFRDVDAFGHVNNAVFLTYFEWGRTLLWFELTGKRTLPDIGFVVARAECDYRRSIGMEPIEIATRIGEMRNSSLDFHAEIRLASGEVAAAGKVVVVLWDWASGSKLAIPEALRKRAETAGGTGL
jgi:acyl-CoA thioester hydrolase